MPAVAPAIGVHVPETQRSQARANAIGVDPVQVPVVAESTCPTAAVPVTAGATVLAGAAGAEGTAAVCVERATAEPTVFVAVTE